MSYFRNLIGHGDTGEEKQASNLPAGVTDKQLEPGCEEYGTLHCREKCSIRDKCPEVNEGMTIYEWLTSEIAECELFINRTTTNSYQQIRKEVLREIRDKLTIEEAEIKIK